MIKVELVERDFDQDTGTVQIEVRGNYEVIKNEVYAIMGYMRKNENDLYRGLMGRLLRDDMISIMPEIAGIDFSEVFKKED